MRYFITCASLAAAVALTACAPTENARATGEVIDDAAITTRVNTALTKNGGLGEAFAVNVTTFRGNVSLSGFVDTEKQKNEAEQVASTVPGVRKVDNNLQVKPAEATGSSGSSK